MIFLINLLRSRIVILLLIAGLCSFTVHAGDVRKGILEPGKSGSSVLEPRKGDNCDVWQIVVQGNICSIKVTVSENRYDLVTDVTRSRYSTAIATSSGPELFISRFSPKPLESGSWFVSVRYDHPEYSSEKSPEKVSYNIRYETNEFQQPLKAIPGKTYNGRLLREEGMYASYRIHVPQGADVLRIDLFNSEGDLDLYSRHMMPIFSRSDAQYITETYFSNETLVLESEKKCGLKPGTYYVNVIDQYNGISETFSIHFSFDNEPPDDAASLPSLRIPNDPMKRLISATVQLFSGQLRGTGCIVNPSGYILTNYHVVKHAVQTGEAVVVSVTIDPARPPLELFKAEVVHYSEKIDMALLKISKTYYDLALPTDYGFPWMEVEKAVQQGFGQDIGILGYPVAGGIRSRVSITYTRGIISGYETLWFGKVIKTDSEISSGNSGGAAFSQTYKLIGLPTSISYGGKGKMGFIHPLELLPAPWWKIIKSTK